MKHKCAVPKCKAIVATNFLMCPAHWRLVPFDVQQDVHAKLRAFKTANTPRLKVAMGLPLRTTQREAINAVQSAEAEMRGEK